MAKRNAGKSGSRRRPTADVVVDAASTVPLEGEDLSTSHWEDASHWIGIYADLVRFKLEVLERVEGEMAALPAEAQKAVSRDLAVIDRQMAGYLARLDLWYDKLWELQGLWIDPDARVIRHKGREVTLTKREFELLRYLLDHPHRYLSTTQIKSYAWGDAALFTEEVHNYVRRLRKILAELGVPVDLINERGRGYSLVFRADP